MEVGEARSLARLAHSRAFGRVPSALVCVLYGRNNHSHRLGVFPRNPEPLLAIAWYSNGRFTALETSMEWVKNMLLDLKKSVDEANGKARGETSRNEADAREPLKQQTLW